VIEPRAPLRRLRSVMPDAFVVPPRKEAAIVARDNADRESAVMADRLVAAFVAEEEEGYNGVLYAKLGYVRKANRKSGLTRRAPAGATSPATPEAG
jgi:hypothetical protein